MQVGDAVRLTCHDSREALECTVVAQQAGGRWFVQESGESGWLEVVQGQPDVAVCADTADSVDAAVSRLLGDRLAMDALTVMCCRAGQRVETDQPYPGQPNRRFARWSGCLFMTAHHRHEGAAGRVE